MAAECRFFRRTDTGAWFAGMQRIEGTFADDGQADADAIAQACGLDIGVVVPVTVDDETDPRTGTTFAAPAAPPDPLAADKQRLWDYMPASGSASAQAITAYIGDPSKDAATRVTLATLRSLIRVLWGERQP